MNRLLAPLLKVVFAILLLALAFWPSYGLAFLMFADFGAHPELYSVIAAIWVGLLAINLPLSLNTFRRVTTISIVGILGVCVWLLIQAGYFAVGNWQAWLITGIFMLGIVIGWWTVSVPLWRWYRATMPTDEAEADGSDR